MVRVSVGSDVDVQVMVDQLRAEHAALNAKILELEHHLSLSSEEQLEMARLKKLKLATKDRIAMLSYR